MKRIALIIIHFLVGVTAAVGGVALIVTDGLGMYRSAVQPLFYSFLIPGLILTFIVGGSNLVAAILNILRHKYQIQSSAKAGFVLIIWLFFEIYITNLPHTLQIIYFGLGIAVLVINMYRLKELIKT